MRFILWMFPFFAVGSYYDDFHQLDSGEIQKLLDEATRKGLYPPES